MFRNVHTWMDETRFRSIRKIIFYFSSAVFGFVLMSVVFTISRINDSFSLGWSRAWSKEMPTYYFLIVLGFVALCRAWYKYTALQKQRNQYIQRHAQPSDLLTTNVPTMPTVSYGGNREERETAPQAGSFETVPGGWDTMVEQLGEMQSAMAAQQKIIEQLTAQLGKTQQGGQPIGFRQGYQRDQ